MIDQILIEVFIVPAQTCHILSLRLRFYLCFYLIVQFFKSTGNVWLQFYSDASPQDYIYFMILPIFLDLLSRYRWEAKSRQPFDAKYVLRLLLLYLTALCVDPM